MTFKCFIPKKFSAESLSIIDAANKIIEAYEEQGFDLTLRQLYYQFVARDYIENTQRSYKRLGSIINDGRLAGLVSWGTIKDRTRGVEEVSTWSDPAQILQSAALSYREDKWDQGQPYREDKWDQGQPYRPEVWVEKEALAGVVEQICRKLEVPFLACRGYVSQSEMWASASRIKRHYRHGQIPVILHLGDHDPSGIDMTRDNQDRLQLLTGEWVSVERLALNMDQIEEYNPPPNPTKLTDSRASEYLSKYGHSSWELDALEPQLLQNLISNAVGQYRDDDCWEAAKEQQEENRAKIYDLERHL